MSKPFKNYNDLVAENFALHKRVERLEREIVAWEECFEINVDCCFCEREVKESEAVSPQGQGIWFCRVCDDELTKHQARHQIEEFHKAKKHRERGKAS